MISLYLSEQGWMHRAPAWLKLLGLAATSIVVLPLQHWNEMAVALTLVIALYGTLGTRVLAKIALIRPLLPLLAIILAFHVWLGTTHDGVVSIMRMLSMILLANLITMTTRMDEMMAVLEPVFHPLGWIGFKPKRLSLAVALMIRFTPVLFALISALEDSYFSRSGKRGGWRLVAPFTIQTLCMADHVSEALAARGGEDGKE